MAGNGYMIDIKGLTKKYGDLLAVDTLDLRINKGEVFGFLGPNGAGKTTTINSILGMIKPTDGDIRVMGRSVLENRRKAVVGVGYLPEYLQLYKNLTGRENLEFFADLRGVPQREVGRLLKEVGLVDAAERKVKGYSKGMAQKLGLAQSLLGNPPLLILDEPTSGLDPGATTMVKRVVRNYADNGGTVFFSSHILPNVQEVADRVAILMNGRLRAIDTVDNLREKLELPSKLRLSLSGDYRHVIRYLNKDRRIKSFQGDGKQLWITCESNHKTDIIREIERKGLKVLDFASHEGDLEDIFLRFTNGGDN